MPSHQLLSKAAVLLELAQKNVETYILTLPADSSRKEIESVQSWIDCAFENLNEYITNGEVLWD